MIYYLICLHLCLTGLYGLYHFRLRHLPHFRVNRLFLLAIPLLCLSLPFMDWGVPDQLEQQLQSWTHEHWEPWQESLAFSEGANPQEKTNPYPWQTIILVLYALGMGGRLLISLRRWWAAYRLLSHHRQTYAQSGAFLCPELAYSCTFFGKIYLGQDYLALGPAERQYLLAHEQVHARKGHSWDLLYLSLFRVLVWCNPLAIKLKDSIQHLHEYQADQLAAPAKADFRPYTRLLLTLQLRAQTLPVAAFTSHPLQLRIKMLQQNQYPTQSRWSRYLLIVPMLGILLGLSAFRSSEARTIVEGVPILEPIVLHVQPLLLDDTHIPSLRPVEGKIVSGFGMRMHPIMKVEKLHSGVDFRGAIGDPVKAAGSGTIVKSENKPKGYGIYLDIDHGNGYVSRYAQLSKVDVVVGQEVKQGDIIGKVGSSGMSKGPHLHYEVRLDGKPIDPEPLFK
ncbi:MAG: peptidoglycan DD-metalloendopeptidase family protein [Bacteroidota bacterium]